MHQCKPDLRYIFAIFLIALFVFWMNDEDAAASEAYNYTPSTTVIGSVETYAGKIDDSLIEIARRYGLGYNEIVHANPGIDPFVLRPGEKVTIATAWILPEMTKYEGIVINLSEMRLYFFPPGSSSERVWTFPIGIGDEGTDTPVGTFRVIEKVKNPFWTVPESIRKDKPELPRVVPPGPDNPLGSHALRLSATGILMHGTNRPYSVGRKASHGCIRMYPEDIPKLFQLVPRRTLVTIVKQPVKVGLLSGDTYIEVHRDSTLKGFNYFDEASRLLKKRNLYEKVDKEKLLHALKKKRGIPVNISP